MAVTKEELEKLLEELREYKGRHTELISVYIPAGYDVNSVQKQLEAEKSTAKNIKSTATRKNVIAALEKLVRYLKDIKKPFENGVALFCGNLSEVEGQTDMKLWAIEPPKPIKVRIYRCDKEFVLEPLEELLEAQEVFGLLVMDRKEATIGLLDGKRIEVLQKMTSGIPSKIRAGGQSSQRFHRITEGLTKEFYKRVADEMKKIFYDMPRLKGIIVGGPIPTKDEFLDGEYLPTKLNELVLGRIDQGDTSESGLNELVEKAEELLASHEITKEKNILNRFFRTLKEKRELAIFDKEQIKKALNFGAVEILIISKDYKDPELKEMKKIAEETSAEVEIVSKDTEEGLQFFNLSGIGAILRFAV